MEKTIWVILNGPSSGQWRDYEFVGPVFGCNFAYRDFPCTDVFAVDRVTVAHIRGDQPAGVYFCTKRSGLELPPGWDHLPTPGIDSGSFAIEQALIRYPHRRLVVIGADGILGQDHHTQYAYPWRRGQQPTAQSHITHRNTVIGLLEKYKPNYVFISDRPDPQIRTQTRDDFIREQNMGMDAQRSQHSTTGI